jgi:hypothetical protein
MSLIETAKELEAAKQRAEYWLQRWCNARTHDRERERFLFRYVRALRACDRLTNDLCTP